MTDYQQLNILEIFDQTIIGLYSSRLKTKNIFKFPDAFKAIWFLETILSEIEYSSSKI